MFKSEYYSESVCSNIFTVTVYLTNNLHLANKITVNVTETETEVEEAAFNPIREYKMKPVFVKLTRLTTAKIKAIQKVIPMCILFQFLLLTNFIIYSL